MCIRCISDPNLFTHFSNPTFDTLLHVDMIRHADSLSVSLYTDPYCSFCTHRLVFSFSQFCSVKHVCVWERERASVLWCCLYLVDVFCFTSCGCWAVVDVLWLMCLRGQTRCPAIGRRWSSTTSTLAWVTVWVACSPASSMPTPTTAGVASSPFTTSELSYSRAALKIHLYFLYQTVKLIVVVLSACQSHEPSEHSVLPLLIVLQWTAW